MFDLRYHVASLAAVFLALVIGILVGVGISDRGLVDKAQRRLLEQRVSQLESDLADARRRGQELAAQQRAAQEFVAETYPTLIGDKLRGKRIALVFLEIRPPELARWQFVNANIDVELRLSEAAPDRTVAELTVEVVLELLDVPVEDLPLGLVDEAAAGDADADEDADHERQEHGRERRHVVAEVEHAAAA